MYRRFTVWNVTMKNGTKDDRECTVRLDRIRFGAVARNGSRIASIPGFKATKDVRVKRQGAIATYERITVFRSDTSKCRVVVQHKPLRKWLPPCTVTITGDDTTGITPEELWGVCEQCHPRKPSLVELAFDFELNAGVDRRYVLRHGVFGKTRRRVDRGGPEDLRYGSRSSPKLVRCYQKNSIDAYRIELEIHSALLRKMEVTKVEDLYLIASIFPKHVRMVSIRWNKLEAHLLRRFKGSGGAVLTETRRIRDEVSLRAAMRFLSAKRVMNPHRFLLPLRVNDQIKGALRRWAKRFYVQEELAVK